MIRVVCPGCQSTLDAKDKLAGQSRKCPKCGQVIQIPSLPEPAEQASDLPDAATEAVEQSVKVEVIEEGLPRPTGPTQLDRTNRYLICNRTSVFIVWSASSGWMVKTNTGLVSAARNPQLLPSEGNFTMVELAMSRDDDGSRLRGLTCMKLAPRWALTALQQDDDNKILTKVKGPGSLNRDQKAAVLHFLREQFMPEVWENSQNVREFLTNSDFGSPGTE